MASYHIKYCIIPPAVCWITVYSLGLVLHIGLLIFPPATAEMAEQHPNKVVGMVSQRKLLKNAGQLHFTPGMCGSHDLV